MYYKESFETLVNQCTTSDFIGLGNPNAQILIVGKEVSTNPDSDDPLEKQNMVSYKNNVSDWKRNIDLNIEQEDVKQWIYDPKLNLDKVDNNPLFAFKSSIQKKTSDTWDKYQKLYDIIFRGDIDSNREKELDFQKDFFITELSNIPSPKTNDAQRQKDFQINLENRKITFFKSTFIQQFPIVLLSCSNYIWNRKDDWQINNLFGVKYDIERKYSLGEFVFSSSNKFYTHYSDDGRKLVIHTRQLSMNVLNEMLKEMGALMRAHLDKISK